MPAGAVEHHQDMGVGWPRGGDVVEEHLHGRRIDRRQHEGDVLAGGGTDRGEDVRPLVAELLNARRAFAAPPPAVADPALVADPRLVFEPQFDAFVALCLLYTSDAADEEDSVDLGGRRIIKKKK